MSAVLLSLGILNFGLMIFKDSVERIAAIEAEGRLAAKYKVGANANPYINGKITHSQHWLSGYIQQLDKEESEMAWKAEHP